MCTTDARALFGLRVLENRGNKCRSLRTERAKHTWFPGVAVEEQRDLRDSAVHVISTLM